MTESTEKTIVNIVGFFIVMSGICLFTWVMNQFVKSDRYVPRCWIKDDQQGLYYKTGVSAIKQFPIDCADFRD